MSKYIFNHDSVSFLVTQGRVESKITATCVFVDSDLNVLFTIEINFQKVISDILQIRSIDLRLKSNSPSDFSSYINGYFELPFSTSVKKELEAMASFVGKETDLLDQRNSKLPDKWVAFSRSTYDWIKNKVIPVVQKELEIHQTFFDK